MPEPVPDFLLSRAKEVSAALEAPDPPKKVRVSYQLAQTLSGEASESLLAAEVAAAALSVPLVRAVVFRQIDFVFDSVLGEADKAKLDAVVAGHTGGTTRLRVAQEKRAASVNIRTGVLINAGFVYAGKTFDLTPTAQLNTIGAYTSRNAPGFAYPVVRFTKDDLDTVSLVDAADVEAFYTATVSAVRVIREAGNALKVQINAATTVEAVNAIQDNR